MRYEPNNRKQKTKYEIITCVYVDVPVYSNLCAN